MVLCRFVGGDCAMIGDREFDAVGQSAEVSEEVFCEVVLGYAHFIPEEDFARCGFTEDELAKYGPSGMRVNPPQSFNDKLTMAQQMFRDVRERIETGGIGVLAEVSNVDV